MSCKMIDALCDATPAGPIDTPRTAFGPLEPFNIELAISVLEKMSKTKKVVKGNLTWLEVNA